jgi:hypothetical protein
MDTKPKNKLVGPTLNDIRTQCLPSKNNKTRSQKKCERFIKGPISWIWACRAANISNSDLKIIIAICFLWGVTKNDTVTLSNKILSELGICRQTKYRVLEAMQSEGLITIHRARGKSPRITILRL